jgi:hypothetical protein
MDDLVETLQQIDDVSLRVAAVLESLDYEIVFMRDDLADEYSRENLDQAYQSMMANQVASHDFSRATSLGSLDSQLFVFENVIVFLFPSSRYSGVFASYDRTESFPIQNVIDTVTDLTVVDVD